MEELGPVERAMVVTPPPDDAEIGCGGTVARLVNAGKQVFYVVATSGNKGGRDTDMTADYLTEARREEQRRAAEVLGVTEVVFLDFGDGELEDDHPFRRELVYHIRRLKPTIVLTTDPFRTSFYIHRDHRMAGLVTLDAVFPYARDRLHYPEHIEQGLDGHNVEEVYFWGSEAPDTFVDIGEVIDQKARAVMVHSSQLGEWIAESGGEEGFIREMKRMSRLMLEGTAAPYEHAEGFRCYGLRRMQAMFEQRD